MILSYKNDVCWHGSEKMSGVSRCSSLSRNNNILECCNNKPAHVELTDTTIFIIIHVHWKMPDSKNIIIKNIKNIMN